MTISIFKSQLDKFLKPGRVYPHRLFKNHYYDDSVRENMLLTGSSWLIERIFRHQEDYTGLQLMSIQHWELKIWLDGSVFLICRDESGHSVLFEHLDPVETPKGDQSYVLDGKILKVSG